MIRGEGERVNSSFCNCLTYIINFVVCFRIDMMFLKENVILRFGKNKDTSVVSIPLFFDDVKNIICNLINFKTSFFLI